MKSELLKLLSRNARYTASQLADMLATDEKTVNDMMKDLEKQGVIKGYKTVIDWERVENPDVSAIIELNVVPKAGLGFEDVAEKIAAYSEVETVYLVSGDYDLHVVVKAKSLQDVAKFVARELAPIDSITATTTNFVMRRYKEMDVKLYDSDRDDRGDFLL
ncbi:MAG: Lrp/AsnC family transcriptional regulator [Clostridia bacterium]|nr:Lrp/AsnC family transcriptional regulator [Clostridia bacterium]